MFNIVLPYSWHVVNTKHIQQHKVDSTFHFIHLQNLQADTEFTINRSR
jgi:hypothetical protein